MQKIVFREPADRILSISARLHTGYLPAIVFFVVINVLKTTIFNFFIINSNSIGIFIYKFLFTMLISILIYFLIFRARSFVPFLLFYIIQAIYIFAYLSYYSYFHNYLHLFQSMALFTEGVGSIKHFTIPVNLEHLILLIDLPLFIYLIKFYKKINWLSFRKNFKSKYVLAVVILLLVSIEVFNYASGFSIVHAAKDYAKAEDMIVERYGTVVNNLCDIVFNKGGKNLINQFEYGQAVESRSVSGEKPNFVIIQVEAMDSNIVNQKHNNEYITPYLHELSQNSIYYPYTLSYHKSGGTSDCEFSVINSVEPLGNFPSMKLTNYDYPNSMAACLSKNGYSTLAFHGNIGNFYNRDVAFKKMGFDEFYDIRKMGFMDEGWGAPDGDVFDFVSEKLKEIDKPFLSYIITMSSHTPFINVQEYYNVKEFDGIEDDTVNNYFNSMAYVDTAIKDFVEDVRSNHENTYIFIFGDHTPGITSEDYIQSSFNSESDYFEFVPLIIITPENKVHCETKAVASFLDISPTILKASEIPFSIRSKGIDIFDPNKILKPIPFNGNNYDRHELFTMIQEQMQQSLFE